MTAPLLATRDLAARFLTGTKIVHAVRGVSFDLAAGERLGIVGESGSGKTTTALALMRMIRPPGEVTAGTALMDGTDLLSLDETAMRAARLSRIAYVPQGSMNALNPVLRISAQVLDGIRAHGVRLTPAEGRRMVLRLLDSVRLPEHVADRYPHELSGGMRQRACIAIAVALKPRVIIADEPTSALDVITQREVMTSLRAVQEECGSGLIMIGHDMGLMAQSVDRVVVMRDGLIVEDAPTRALFRRPAHPYSRMLIDSVPSLANRPVAPPAGPQPHAPGAPLLELRKVRKSFSSGWARSTARPALSDFSLCLHPGEARIITVVGQSGSGKTTMARIMLGLERPTSGSVLYRGRTLGSLGRSERLSYRRDVQAIFQDPYATFNPFYTIDRTLVEPMRRFGLAQSGAGLTGQLADACRRVGLTAREVLGRYPHELSGGQRQRLIVARALLMRPKIIVADEPVSMVDASLRMDILDRLREIQRADAVSIIYITHDLATAYHLSDTVLVLHQGNVVESGPPDEVIERPRHAYTQALVSAIPWPDPDREWGARGMEPPSRQHPVQSAAC